MKRYPFSCFIFYFFVLEFANFILWLGFGWDHRYHHLWVHRMFSMHMLGIGILAGIFTILTAIKVSNDDNKAADLPSHHNRASSDQSYRK